MAPATIRSLTTWHRLPRGVDQLHSADEVSRELEAAVGNIVGLIALFSSNDHLALAYRQLLHLFADVQLAVRSRRRDAARERSRVARVNALRNRLDRGRLACQLDTLHHQSPQTSATAELTQHP